MSATEIPADPAVHLRLILETLRQFIGAHANRNRSTLPVLTLLWHYLRRVEKRFAALVRDVAAGKARAGKVSAGGAGTAPPRTRAAPAVPRAPKPRLPTAHGWLLRIVPVAGQAGAQFKHFLSGETFAALLAADPRAGQILRPLCHMLGLGPRGDYDLPPALFQPIPRRKPVPASTAPDATTPPPPAPEWRTPPSEPRPPPQPPPLRAVPA